MSYAKEVFELNEKLTENVGFKVNKSTYLVLQEVYNYRKEKGLCSDFSHFVRQCLQVALMCDDPETYVPKFDIPKLSKPTPLDVEVENQQNIEGTDKIEE